MLCRVRILFILVQRGFTDGIQKRDNKHAKDYRTELPTVKMLEENMDIYFVPVSIAFGELFNRILVGAAFSLFIAGLVRRSKLPFNPQEF